MGLMQNYCNTHIDAVVSLVFISLIIKMFEKITCQQPVGFSDFQMDYLK